MKLIELQELMILHIQMLKLKKMCMKLTEQL